ncbi:MAG: hypothetical protein FVQ85_14980 [Planctomycetes bacterium]|nr:hypothetical protein [Planctomycetota bacterium]
MSITLLILLLGLIVGLGHLYDQLTLNKKKSAHILFLTGLWDKVDTWQTKDFPKLAIRIVLRRLNFTFGGRKTLWLPLILFSIASISLTFIAINLGYYLHSTPEFHSQIVSKHPVFFIINWFFDGLTVLATIFIFSKAESRPNYQLFFLIPINLAVAILLSILCLASSTYSSQTILGRNYSTNSTFFPPRALTDPPGVPKNEIQYLSPSARSHFTVAYKTLAEWATTRKPPIIRGLRGYEIKKGHDVFGIHLEEDSIFMLDATYSLPMLFFSTTTLLPISLWAVIISLLGIAKASLLGFKWMMCHILEKQTESPSSYSPGKLTATFIVIVVAILRIIFEIY